MPARFSFSQSPSKFSMKFSSTEKFEVSYSQCVYFQCVHTCLFYLCFDWFSSVILQHYDPCKTEAKLCVVECSYPVFRGINTLGAEAQNEPYSCPISMKLTVWTYEYLNIECLKHDWDQFSSFWDMDKQNLKVGRRIYLSRCVYLAKYGMWLG